MTYGRISRFGQKIQRATRLVMERDGVEVLYTPRSRCSCQREDGQAQVGCRVCDGYGWFWRPEQERRVRAIVQNAQRDREFADFGVVTRGDLVVVLDRRVDAAPYDRVRLYVDSLRSLDTPTEAEVVERDPDFNGAPEDRLSQRVAVMLDVLQTDPLTGGYERFRPGLDYTVAGNAVSWVAGGRAPRQGQRYSALYLADYDWVATQPPVPRHAGTTGIGGKLLFTRRIRDQRDAQDLAADAYIAELQL